MKNLILILTIAASFILTTAATNNAQRGFATVNQYQGLLIFTDSKPNSDYQYLGTVKPSDGFVTALGANSSQYTAVRDRLIKSAKKKFPEAEALILDLKDGGIDRADVVKFK